MHSLENFKWHLVFIWQMQQWIFVSFIFIISPHMDSHIAFDLCLYKATNQNWGFLLFVTGQAHVLVTLSAAMHVVLLHSSLLMLELPSSVNLCGPGWGQLHLVCTLQ